MRFITDPPKGIDPTWHSRVITRLSHVTLAPTKTCSIRNSLPLPPRLAKYITLMAAYSVHSLSSPPPQASAHQSNNFRIPVHVPERPLPTPLQSLNSRRHLIACDLQHLDLLLVCTFTGADPSLIWGISRAYSLGGDGGRVRVIVLVVVG